MKTKPKTEGISVVEVNKKRREIRYMYGAQSFVWKYAIAYVDLTKEITERIPKNELTDEQKANMILEFEQNKERQTEIENELSRIIEESVNVLRDNKMNNERNPVKHADIIDINGKVAYAFSVYSPDDTNQYIKKSGRNRAWGRLIQIITNEITNSKTFFGIKL